MADKEIKLSDYELDACGGNLKTLAAAWGSVPKIGCRIKKSRGSSADSIRDLPEAVKECSAAVNRLLSNSVGFFAAVGVSFEESDRTAAQNIDTLPT